MTFQSSDEFVHRFIETGQATAHDIDQLIRIGAKEDLRIEWKGGDWLTPSAGVKPSHKTPAKGGKRLEAWTAAFANCEGGVLLVGVDQDSHGRPIAVNGQTCSDFASGPDALRTKVRDALRSLTQQLHFEPRIQVLEHANGMVLLVGVSRAPWLVRCLGPGGAVQYWMRTFDGSSPLPDAVAMDLLVGRRERPLLALEVWAYGVRPPQGVTVQRDLGPPHRLTLNFKLVNESLVWLPDIVVGFVLPSLQRAPHQMGMTEQLRASVENPTNHQRNHERVGSLGALPPFSEALSSVVMSVPASEFQIDGRWSSVPAPSSWSIAAYAVAPGHPPVWWEVSGTVLPSGDIEIETTPSRERRPRVFFGDASSTAHERPGE